MNETIERNYELRTLTAKDVFPVCAIIDKIGVKEFKGCMASDEVQKAIKKMNGKATDDSLSAIGMTVMLDIAGVIISHISAAEDDIFSFLSSLSGISKKDLKDIPLPTFAQMIIDVVQKEEFKDFFSVVSGFLK